METTRKVAIIGDSLIKHIGEWETTKGQITNKIKTFCFRGCNTARLLHKLRNNKIPLSENIIVMIGTNDTETKSRGIIQGTIALIIEQLQQDPRTQKIIILGILPRPLDHESSWEKISRINEWLARDENKAQGKYEFWKSHKAFINKRRFREMPTIKNELYARDGLHLSQIGNARLLQQLKMAISKLL